MSLDALEEILGHRFADRDLLQRALTHRSWAAENDGEDNERLEFLGDAVLQIVVTDLVMKDVDGFEVMRRLEEIAAGSYLPVLMVVPSKPRVHVSVRGCGGDETFRFCVC